MSKYFQPTIINFGKDEFLNLGKIVKKYGRNVILVTDKNVEPLKNLFDKAKEILSNEGIEFYHFDKVIPNPTTDVIDEGLDVMSKNNFDVVLSIGGGSTNDTSKILALMNKKTNLNWEEMFDKYSNPFADYENPSDNVLPIITVPTTSGTGSQVTQAAVITYKGEKLTVYHKSVFSKETVLDPNLMLTLPNYVTATSGFDAFTHAFESYCSKHATPFSREDSKKAMRTIIRFLPKVINNPDNVEYREQMVIADLFAGRALANAGAIASHPIAEMIGGFKISHGESLAITFPEFINHSYDKYKKEFDEILEILKEEAQFLDGSENLMQVFEKFLNEIKLNTKLSKYDITDEQFLELIKKPIWDHLPFGDREYFERILYAIRKY